MSSQKVIVLGYKGYDFEDDKGRKVSGANIYMLSDIKQTGELIEGYLPMTEGYDLPMVSQLLVPAVYDANYSMVPGKKGKAELKLTSLEYIASVDFDKFFNV